MKVKMFQRGMILVGSPLLLGLLLIASLFGLMNQAEHEQNDEARFRKLVSLTARVMSLCTEEMFMRPVLMLQGGSEKVQKRQQDLLSDLHFTWSDIKTFFQKNPDIIDTAKRKSQVDWLITYVDQFLGIIESGGEGGMGLGMDRSDEMQQNLEFVKQMQDMNLWVRQKTATAQTRVEDTNKKELALLIAGIFLNIAMGIALATYYRKGILQRIHIIAKNTGLLAEGKALLPQISGSDEIALLDHSFHQMYQQVQVASENESKLFNNASDVICVLNGESKFMRINPACTKEWGYVPEELIGASLADILDPADLDSATGSIEAGKAKGEPSTFEAQIKTKFGAKSVGLWSTYWSPGDLSLYCIVHDITQRKLLESMRAQFLRMMSADLKRPLAEISHAINQVLSSSSDIKTSAQQKFENARGSVSRLIGLVDDLLQVAEMGADTLVLSQAQCDLTVLLKRAADDLEFLAAEKNLKIRVESDSATAFADSEKIMRVLVNLLSNAIKFSTKGKEIVISSEVNGPIVTCRVKDEGRGVPASMVAEIFEKFKQVGASDGKRKAGTGLGLAICKQIVEAHGGKIGVESQEGLGSCFWFTLPVEKTLLPTKVEEMNQDSAESEPMSLIAPQAQDLSAFAESESSRTKSGPRLNLSSFGFILVGIPVLFEIVFSGMLMQSISELQAERKIELHQRKIATKSGELLMLIIGGNFNLMYDRGNSLPQTGELWKDWAAELEALLKDDEESLKYFAKVQSSAEKLGRLLRSAGADKGASADKRWSGQVREDWRERIGEGGGERRFLRQGLKMLPLLLSLTRSMTHIIDRAEDIEFLSPDKEQLIRQRQDQILLAGLAANIVVSLLLALQFSNGISRRLAILADNAGRVAREQNLNPYISGADELTDLDRSFHRDAASLIESRRKERAVFDNCKDVLCTVTESGRLSSSNPAAESLWGYSKDELAEASVIDFVVPEERERTRAAFKDFIAQESELEYECRILRKDGKVVHCLWTVSAKKEQNSLFCTVRDVSAEKELEQLRQEFLSLVSHDLRTPLTAISGVAQLGQATVLGELSADSQEALAVIVRNCYSLLELINDILDLEKLEAGQLQLHYQDTDLRALLGDLSKLIGDGKMQHEIADELLDTSLKVDRERLCQAVASLMRFMLARSDNDNGVRITAVKRAANLELSIHDQGPLIPDQIRNQVFDRFKDFSLDLDQRFSSFHADLRLPLAGKIIQLHQGTVSFEQSSDSSSNVCCISFVAGN